MNELIIVELIVLGLLCILLFSQSHFVYNLTHSATRWSGGEKPKFMMSKFIRRIILDLASKGR